MKVIEFLKQVLEDCDKPQYEVCRSVKVAQSTLSHVMRGRSDPRLDTFVKLGGPLGYEVQVVTRKAAFMLGIKAGKADLVEENLRRKETRLERLATFYSRRLSPDEIEDLCEELEMRADHIDKQKKKLAKAS